MISLRILLPCSQARAFQIFTEEIDEWWPPACRRFGDQSKISLDDDGRIWERNDTGEFMDIGRVLERRPPEMLTFEFYLGTGVAAPTHVEMTCRPTSEGSELTVIHGPTDASRDTFYGWVFTYESSWNQLLSSLTAYAKA